MGTFETKKSDDRKKVENSRGEKTKKHNSKLPTDFNLKEYLASPEYEKMRSALSVEINKHCLKIEKYVDKDGKERFVTESFRRFQKSAEEKEIAKAAKLKHKAECRKYGVNPKKQINVTINDILKATENLSKKFKVVTKQK